MIRNATTDDAKAICSIYNHYIENTIISFEEAPVSVEEMQHRMTTVTLAFPWIVFEKEGRVVGYAYASMWKTRSAYRHSAESAVYLLKDVTGQGIGTKLYRALISNMPGHGIHSLIGGIALPNPPSVALHEKMGFEKVAHFKEVGFKFNQWIDVGYWERLMA